MERMDRSGAQGVLLFSHDIRTRAPVSSSKYTILRRYRKITAPMGQFSAITLPLRCADMLRPRARVHGYLCDCDYQTHSGLRVTHGTLPRGVERWWIHFVTQPPSRKQQQRAFVRGAHFATQMLFLFVARGNGRGQVGATPLAKCNCTARGPLQAFFCLSQALLSLSFFILYPEMNVYSVVVY